MSLTNEQRAHDWALENMKAEMEVQSKAILANQDVEMKNSLEIYLESYDEALAFFDDHFERSLI